MTLMNRIGKWFPCFSSIRRWYDKHIYFSKAALFIFGLVFSHSFVNYGVVKILMDYLTDSWTKQHLAKATAIKNLQDGVSTISEVIVAHLADSYFGRFNMIVICAITYITGLALLYFSTQVGIYVGLLAVALGISGQNPVLKAFLADQLGSREDHKDEEKIESRLNVWWGIAWSFGSIASIYESYKYYAEWKPVFIISIVVMDASLLLFCIGFPFYNNKKPVQMRSPLNICFRVFKAAIFNLHLNYPHTPEQFHKNCNNEITLSPEVPLLRWLDKAAIAKGQSSLGEQEGSGEQDLEYGNGLSKSMDSLGRFENTGLSDSSREEESHGMPCTVKEVSEVKCLLTLVPIWTNFFACGLVKATGDTFFMEQSSNLLYSNFRVFMFILLSLIRYAIQFPFRWEKVRQKFGPLKRIGAGMVCSILCCISAWQVEIQRKKLIKKEGIDPDAQGPEAHTTSMNIFVLFPQFLLLGLMEGLGEGGLETFVDNHIPKSFSEYGSLFSGCVLGSAYFFSIPLLLLFRSWFGDTINKGHLERYFLFLAILNTIFFCFYLLALSKYAHMDPSENVKSKDSEEGTKESKDSEEGAKESEDSEEGAKDSLKSKPHKQWSILRNATATGHFRRRYLQSTRVQNQESTGEKLPFMPSNAFTKSEEVAPMISQVANKTNLPVLSQVAYKTEVELVPGGGSYLT